MVGQLVNFLMPSRMLASASTLRAPYLTPVQHGARKTHTLMADVSL